MASKRAFPSPERCQRRFRSGRSSPGGVGHPPWNAANRMMDDVGLVAYEPSPAGDDYQARKIPTHLELDRVLSRVCTALRNLP